MYLTAAMTGLRRGELVSAPMARRGLDRWSDQGSLELRAGRVRHSEVAPLDEKRADGR